MDIFVFDIEIRVENFFFPSDGSSEEILDLDKSIQTNGEDHIIFSPVSEKQISENEEIICCSDDKCNVSIESMISVRPLPLNLIGNFVFALKKLHC